MIKQNLNKKCFTEWNITLEGTIYMVQLKVTIRHNEKTKLNFKFKALVSLHIYH